MKQPNLTPNNKQPLFIFSNAAMELCWMSTWAVYCSLLVTSSGFPIPMAMVVFIFSACLTVSLDNIARLRWHFLLVHMIGFLFSVTAMWWISRHTWPIDFSRGWQMGLQLGLFLTQPKSDAQWPTILFLGVWILLFWMAGAAWSRRPHTHQSVCNRFDLGASLLFLLFIIKLLLLKRFNIVVDASFSIYLLASFFLFGMLSIGYAKKHDSGQDHDQQGYRSGAILPVFVIAIIFFGFGSISFILPYFETIAQIAYNGIKEVAAPLTSWFGHWLIFLFKTSPDTGNRLKQQIDEAPQGPPPVESIVSPHDTFMHGAALFYGILAMLTWGLMIWLIYRWLRGQKTSKRITNQFSTTNWIVRRFKQIKAVVVEIIRAMKRKKEVGYFYAALIKWGKHSGVSHRPNETPREYADRLAQRCPEAGSAVINIAEHYNACIYGDQPFDDVILTQVQNARRKLRSPKLWPARIKPWFSLDSGA